MPFLFEVFSRAFLIQLQKILINKSDQNPQVIKRKVDIDKFNIEKWKAGYEPTPVADVLTYILCIIGVVISDFSFTSIVMYGAVIVLCEVITIISKVVRCRKEYVLLFSVLYNNPINDYINLLDKFILAFPKRKDFKVRKAEALLYSGEIGKALHYAKCLNEKFPSSKYYQRFEEKIKIVCLFLQKDDLYKSISFSSKNTDTEFEKLCFVIGNLDSMDLRNTNLNIAKQLYDSPIQFYKSLGAMLLSKLYSLGEPDKSKEYYNASIQYSLSEEMTLCIRMYAQDLF